MNKLEQFKETCRIVRDGHGHALGAIAPIDDLWVSCDRNTKFEVFLDRQTARNHLTNTMTVN